MFRRNRSYAAINVMHGKSRINSRRLATLSSPRCIFVPTKGFRVVVEIVLPLDDHGMERSMAQYIIMILEHFLSSTPVIP